MLRCGVILAFCLGAGAAGAHEMNRSYTLVSVGDDSLRLSVTLNDLDLRSLVPSLDRNGDQALWGAGDARRGPPRPPIPSGRGSP